MSRILLGRLACDRRGATAVLTALLMTTMLGFVGLGVDASLWLHLRQSAQAAADNAATSGAMAGNDAGPGEARAIAAAHGLVDGNDGVRVTSGWRKAQHGATFEVDIRRPAPLMFAKLFISATSEIAVQAVARPDASCAGKPGCAVQLVG